MEQDSLFSRQDTSTGGAAVRFFPSFEGWRDAAREPLQAGVEPQSCEWLSDISVVVDGASRTASGSATRISSEFVQLARAASCHRSADRWALMYSIAWRIIHQQPHLMELRSDPQVARLHKYAKAVARDAHKMKAFVRFRTVQVPGRNEPRYVSWFEPDHYIVEFISGFFQRRFTNMAWSILTPRGCVHWEGDADGALWFSPASDKQAAPDEDRFEDYWRIYYKSIFNPARLKITAMQSEMPQKYWKNLPEASLIGELVRGAGQATTTMLNTKNTEDILHCGPRPTHPVSAVSTQRDEPGPVGLLELAERAKTCARCHLCEAATQTVFGAGASNAQLLIVGEQPGDQEDLQGLPFVGPAGQVLNRALESAGIDRDAIYLTNAVKHFKFKPRGKHRIHSKPSADELRACLPWLQAELREIKPTVIVCLGSSAAYALLGSRNPISTMRGAAIDVQDLPGGPGQVFITHHPSHALRSASGGDVFSTQAYRNIVSDLICAVRILESG